MEPDISKSARDRLSYNGTSIGNSICGIEWSHDPRRHLIHYGLTALHAPGRGCDGTSDCGGNTAVCFTMELIVIATMMVMMMIPMIMWISNDMLVVWERNHVKSCKVRNVGNFVQKI